MTLGFDIEGLKSVALFNDAPGVQRRRGKTHRRGSGGIASRRPCGADFRAAAFVGSRLGFCCGRPYRRSCGRRSNTVDADLEPRLTHLMTALWTAESVEISVRRTQKRDAALRRLGDEIQQQREQLAQDIRSFLHKVA
jgi:hypothetical protein